MTATVAYAAEPAKTLISDTVFRADGSPASGTLLISWPAFVTADAKPVAAGTLTVRIGAGGAVNIPLVPTQGATPSGTYYRVVVKLDSDRTSTEYWSVPTLSPTTIAAIRSSVVPTSVAMQVVSREYVDSGLAGTVHKAGDETVAGVKEFTSSPLVPAPATASAAANKQYVDAAVGNGSGVLALDKGGTNQTAWTAARCVRVASDGSKLESASADCGTADTLDGKHAGDFQSKVALSSSDYGTVQAALNAAGASGAVIIPPGHSGADTSWTNGNSAPVMDWRNQRFHFGDQFQPAMFYLGALSTDVASVRKNISNAATTYYSGLRSDMDAASGGRFTSTEQPAYFSVNAQGRMVTKGQLVGLFAYTQGLGLGNTMGFNAIANCWGGGGKPVGICSPTGELTFSEGNFAGGGTSIFLGNVTGTPALGATTITYAPVQGENILGERPLFNLDRMTTSGTVTAIGTTAVANDTFTFNAAASPVWDEAAAACSGTAAGVHCNPAGEYIKLGSTSEYYSAPCTGDDVSFPTDATKCVGHWYKVIAVVSSTQLQIEVPYDNANLTHGYPASYALMQGAVLNGVDATNHAVTLPANSYQWTNGERLYSPPYHLGYFYGLYVGAVKHFRSGGTGAAASNGILISNSGSGDMDSGVEITSGSKGFRTYLKVNPGNTPAYGIDVAGSYTGADIKLGSGAKIKFGDSGTLFGDAGNTLTVSTGLNIGSSAKLTLSDMGTYASIGTFLANRPLYFATNGAVRGSVDGLGRWAFGMETTYGHRLEVNGNIYASSQFISGAATGTAPLALSSTTRVDNLNADLLDSKHAADFANASHGHAEAEITNLVTDLAGKAGKQTAADVVSGARTGSKCLHTSADGAQITEAAADCGSGSTGLGDPGGNGLVARNSVNNTVARSITTADASRITVTNGDGVSGNPTLDLGTAVPRIVYVENCTTAGNCTGGNQVDASNSAQGATETAFASSFAIPASALVANRAYRVEAYFDADSAASPPSLTLRLRLNGVSGTACYTPGGAVIPSASQSGTGFGAAWMIQGTTAAGSAAGVECGVIVPPMIPAGTYANSRNMTVQPVSVNTTVAQSITITAQWGSAGNGNRVRLRQMVVWQIR